MEIKMYKSGEAELMERSCEGVFAIAGDPLSGPVIAHCLPIDRIEGR